MTFLADKVPAALVRVHVLLQVVGLEEVLVALRALYSSFAASENTEARINKSNYERVRIYRKLNLYGCAMDAEKATYCV